MERIQRKKESTSRGRGKSGSGEGGGSGGSENVTGCEEGGVNREGDLVVIVAKGRSGRPDHRHNRLVVHHFCFSDRCSVFLPEEVMG